MSKFKNTEELEKAYKELEREFTKKSQKLAEVEKTNYVTLLHNEMDNLLNDYAKRRIADLEAKLAEKDKLLREKIGSLKTTDFIKLCLDCGFMVDAKDKDNQDKISFAVDILEELADCSKYINSKLDFESGSYVSEKAIRDKIKYLKGNENE